VVVGEAVVVLVVVCKSVDVFGSVFYLLALDVCQSVIYLLVVDVF
jgi:hypothetical protein